jgi:hypothetical protein
VLTGQGTPSAQQLVIGTVTGGAGGGVGHGITSHLAGAPHSTLQAADHPSVPVAPAAAPTIESGNYVISTPLGDYVGQSGQISVRLQQHVANGKFTQAEVHAAQRFAVPGTKLDREIAEQALIDSMGGVDNLLNVVNPIGPARFHVMPNQPYTR